MKNARMTQWAIDDIGRTNLKIVESEVRQPQDHEIRVRTEAVALNYRDKLVLETGMNLPLRFPFVPGSDMAGIVEATGAAVSRFRPGDRVITTFHPGWLDGLKKPQGDARHPPHHTLGGYYPGVLSQYVTFHEDWFVRAPSSLDPVQASTLPCAGLTAWFALVELGRCKAGDVVVVQGTGGVSLFALTIAEAYGATVIVTSSSTEKRARLQNLGADHVIARGGWADEVLAITRDVGADHILEMAAGENFAASLKAIAVGGRISVIGVLEGFSLNGPVQDILLKTPVIQGIGVGHRRALEDLVAAVDAKGLTPVIDRQFAFDALPNALAALDSGPFGKIVIRF